MEEIKSSLLDKIMEIIKPTTFLSIALLAVVVLVIYMIMHPEKVQIWYGFILSASKKSSAQKKSITNKVSGFYKRQMKEIPEGERELYPSDIRIVWQDGANQDRESFLQGKQAIVKIEKTDSFSKALSLAALEAVKTGTLVDCKVCLEQKLCLASDYLLTRKLLISMDNHAAITYFSNKLLMPLCDADQEFKDKFERLQKVDHHGMYVPVFLSELSSLSEVLVYDMQNPIIKDEINRFLDFLFGVCERKFMKLSFPGRYIKAAIAFTGTDERLSRENPYSFYVKKSFEAFETGIKTVYLFALGRKIHDAQEIEKEFASTYPGFANVKPINFTHVSTSGGLSKKDGICIVFQKAN